MNLSHLKGIHFENFYVSEQAYFLDSKIWNFWLFWVMSGLLISRAINTSLEKIHWL